MFDHTVSTNVIIPARAGSKRVLNKNKKVIFGKPLIEWTIDVALSCFDKDKIHVSTDDEEIISIANEKGLNVKTKRPSYLCDDTSTTRAVVLYELNKRKIEHGTVMILQPTSPLRTKEDVLGVIAAYEEKKATGIVSVCECEHPPEWCNVLPANMSMHDFLRTNPHKRSQEYQTAYRINGAVYLYDVKKYKNVNNIINDPKTFAYIMDKESSIDIDDELDFKIANILLSERRHNV